MNKTILVTVAFVTLLGYLLYLSIQEVLATIPHSTVYMFRGF